MTSRRSFLQGISAAVLTTHQVCQAMAQEAVSGSVLASGSKGIMLMNRIGPSSAELYIANADGSAERKLLQDSVFEHNACFTSDGNSVLFTSERNGSGQSDLFRARLDGTGIEPLVTGPAVDDAAALSPDGKRLAFVSTRNGYRANIWVLDLQRGGMRNLTGADDVQGDPSGPDGFFRPSWSPDSQWLAFSSDRNTDWRGHDDGRGWEHTQELSIYVIRADGQGFRRIASKPGYCLGSPKWSPDGKRMVFYEMTTEETWGARRPNLVASVASQIVSVDVATGERVEHTSGPGLKVFPQFLSATEIAYHRKGGPDEGLVYTSRRPGFKAALRSPTWSPDGKTVIYEKVDFKPRPQNQKLYSWDPELGIPPHGRVPHVVAGRQAGHHRESPELLHRDHGSGWVQPKADLRGRHRRPGPHEGCARDGRSFRSELVTGRSMDRVRSRRMVSRTPHWQGTDHACAPGRHGGGSPHRRHGAFGIPKLFGGRQADRLSRLGREQCGPAHPQP